MFKVVNNFPNYAVSKDGVVKRLAGVVTGRDGRTMRIFERIRKPHKDKRGYWRITLGGKSRLLHRLVAETWLKNPKKHPYVDHIDGDFANCQVSNLRWVDQQCNQLNRHVVVAKSGCTGVHKLKKKLRKPWIAAGKLNKKAIHLGTFATFQEAAKARRIWESKVGATTFKNTQKNVYD